MSAHPWQDRQQASRTYHVWEVSASDQYLVLNYDSGTAVSYATLEEALIMVEGAIVMGGSILDHEVIDVNDNPVHLKLKLEVEN